MTASSDGVRLGIWLVLLVVCACVAPHPLLAHARVVRSIPAKDTEVSAPARIEIWFNELLDDGFNSIEIFPVAELNRTPRSNATQGEARVDAKDRTHLIGDVQPLPAGEYIVEWRVLSRDGHSAPGRFRFRVRGAP